MQSIQLLHMTHLEINQFIAQEIEKNPLLELASNDEIIGDAPETATDSAAQSEAEGDVDRTSASDWYEEGKDGALSEGMDANFGEAYSDEASPTPAAAPELIGQWKSMPGSGSSGEAYDLEDFVAGHASLRDHLEQQLPLAIRDPADRLIAAALVDQLDDTGYLHCALADIAAHFTTDIRHVERVLDRLQSLDPPGVFARSLSECLAIQLRQRDRLDPAMLALVNNLTMLAKRDFASLKKLCGVNEEDLVDMLSEIRKLNPKPGSDFDRTVSEAVVPDILVRAATDGSWMIELNSDVLPRVIVNQIYAASVTRKGVQRTADQAFLSECLQNANWLTRSLDQRAKTIMRVATEIVRQQDAFLRHGVNHLRPLNLKAVAEAIKMHESTVSRVTANKYMLTPRGLFELKYFFSVSINASDSGDSHSAESVRHRIRALITAETPEAVLSDDDIVTALRESGIDLARRTVAKYREAMNIPSSVQRRREKRALARAATA
ncbi:RNA polymerase sigma-54 factor [Rhizobium halophytocola]|uniref:RNA polymerase sigma-54 factor n=2 Tax=Rhizobium halophytocola TaxID=735519 RepID=A0ABS4E009_9HYPH|nr:RNA polymerase sigma-54 factor [Rhizobium halophytocola]